MVTLEVCLGSVLKTRHDECQMSTCRNRNQDVFEVLLSIRLRTGWFELCGNTGGLSGKLVVFEVVTSELFGH